MTTTVLVLGSNYGDRVATIRQGLSYLRNHHRVMKCSEIYESPDCKGTSRRYLNAVAEVATGMEEEALNAELKKVEKECGRDEERRHNGEVPLDIDIVVWDGEIRRPGDYKAAYFREGYEEIGGG